MSPRPPGTHQPFRPDVQASGEFLERFGEPAITGVAGDTVLWANDLKKDGEYSFTLRNSLALPVANVNVAVVFRDEKGSAIDADPLFYDGVIPPGLARRLEGRVHESVKCLVTPTKGYVSYQDKIAAERGGYDPSWHNVCGPGFNSIIGMGNPNAEVRVLSFTVVRQ